MQLRTQIKVKVHAKINLTLDITGTRGDGYHLIESVMQSVDIHDTLVMEIFPSAIEQTCVVTNSEQLRNAGDNLAYKAAETFFGNTGICNPGIVIKLRKRIPIAAGLGGGSADAAGVIVGLNRLCNAGLSLARLCEIGAEIGADVPFCLAGGTMLARGTGTQLEPLPDLPGCVFVLAKAGQKLSTAHMYELYDKKGCSARPKTDEVIRAIEAHDLDAVGGGICNVFEQLWDSPQIPKIKRIMLDHGALGAGLSGSGSTVFGMFADQSGASVCADKLRETISRVYICRPAKQGCMIEIIE